MGYSGNRPFPSGGLSKKKWSGTELHHFTRLGQDSSQCCLCTCHLPELSWNSNPHLSLPFSGFLCLQGRVQTITTITTTITTVTSNITTTLLLLPLTSLLLLLLVLLPLLPPLLLLLLPSLLLLSLLLLLL